MKGIVLFDTLFGNTERVASRLAAGLQETGIDAEYLNIKGVAPDRLIEYDLIALGAPTQYHSASKPMKDFLEQLKTVNLRGKYGSAFDTKFGYPLSGCSKLNSTLPSSKLRFSSILYPSISLRTMITAATKAAKLSILA